MHSQLEQLKHLQSRVEKTKSDLKSILATKKEFSDFRRQQLRNSPSEVSGYTSELTQVSQSGKTYTQGLSNGWTLKSIVPHTHSLTFVWQTEEVSDEQIAKNIEKKISEEFKAKHKPFEEAVSIAEAELSSFKDEWRELNNILKSA